MPVSIAVLIPVIVAVMRWIGWRVIPIITVTAARLIIVTLHGTAIVAIDRVTATIAGVVAAITLLVIAGVGAACQG
jgi:hypothetical protein